jgi:hypothetical protein
MPERFREGPSSLIPEKQPFWATEMGNQKRQVNFLETIPGNAQFCPEGGAGETRPSAVSLVMQIKEHFYEDNNVE